MHTHILKRGQVEAGPVVPPDLVGAGTAPKPPSGGPGGPSGGDDSGPAAVRPIQENGVVRALEVTCACGAVTVVELDYPEATQ